MLALGGIVGPLVFAVVVVVCGALRPGYSHVTSFISELGVPGTPYSALMNYAGFVPAGLLIAVFGATLAYALPRDRLAVVAATLVATFGIGIAAAGLISCDLGCPQGTGSAENVVHNTIAPVSFLCLIAAAGLLGVRFRRLPAWRPLWLFSLLTSACALCLLALLANSLDARDLTGLWQRLLLAALFAWCAIVGFRVSTTAGSVHMPTHG